MSVENYAQFLERIGQRVVQTPSCWWHSVSAGMYQSFPYHQCVLPSREELRQVLGLRGLVARLACPPAAGIASHRLVVDNDAYGLASLSSRTRTQTRRGLEQCSIRQLEFSELEGAGALELASDTLARQGSPVAANHDVKWRRYWAAAANIETLEAWGALCEGRLAAFLIACRIDACMNIFILRSHRRWLKQYPNNALVYTFTCDALARSNVREVSFGLASVRVGIEKLDDFKTRMGYLALPIGQRVELHPLLQLAGRTPLLRVIRHLAERRPNRPALGKLAGILRWYGEQPPRQAAA